MCTRGLSQRAATLAAVMFVALTVAGADWSDDFESYAAGSTIANQGQWETWDRSTDPAANAQVVDTRAASGTNSLRIVGSSDIVQLFQDVNAGVWAVRAKAYVPSTQTGALYFILLNAYTHGQDNPKNWSVQLAMSATSGTVEDAGGSAGGPGIGTVLPLVVDAWAEIVVEIDFDNNFHSIYYNGDVLRYGFLFAGGVDSQIGLGAIDLWSSGSTESYFDDVAVEQLCVPVQVERSVELPSEVSITGVDTPAYVAGDTLSATLSLASVRAAGGPCPDLGDVTITEQLPPGWRATNVSDGGTEEGGTVTWTIPAAELAPGELTYDASGPVAGATIAIEGTIQEQGNDDIAHVRGEEIPTEQGLARGGEILSWLLLGPYMHTAGRPPQAEVMRQDHLTDGMTTIEEEVMPEAFDAVETDFDVAASTGLAPASNFEINAAAVPEWFPWRDLAARVELGDGMLYGAVDDVMCYAVCYLCAEEAMTVTFFAGSDDGIQILLGDTEVWINPVDRAWPGLADVFQANLDQGVNRLMVKVFESGGDWNFGVAVRDEFGHPIAEGLTVTLEPGACGGEPPPASFKRGDSNRDGTVNIADAVYVLQNLFAAGPAILCMDAADSNDDESVNIADAVYVLQNLFAAGPAIPAPGVEVCGPDPTPHPTPGEPDLPPCEYCEGACKTPPVACP